MGDGVTLVFESHVTLESDLGFMEDLAVDKYAFYRFGNWGFVR